MRTFSTSPLAALVAHDPDEGQRLAEDVFGPVLDLPDDDRDALLQTLYAFLDHAGSADHAARDLHCHPNTVRYRPRRLRELTGRSLTDPTALAELSAAAEAVRLHPRPTPGHRAPTTQPGQPDTRRDRPRDRRRTRAAGAGGAWSLLWPGTPVGTFALVGAAALIGAGMQAPLAGLAIVRELTHTGFAPMVPAVAATFLATAVARWIDDAYSVYSARPAARPVAERDTLVPATMSRV